MPVELFQVEILPHPDPRADIEREVRPGAR